jgi:hypothetical protein
VLEAKDENEFVICLSDKNGENWYFMADHYQTLMRSGWTAEEADAWNKKMGRPLYWAIRSGKAAVVMDETIAIDERSGPVVGYTGLLVMIEDDRRAKDVEEELADESGLRIEELKESGQGRPQQPLSPSPPLFVHRVRPIVLSHMDPPTSLVAKKTRDVADIVAKDQCTKELVAANAAGAAGTEAGRQAVKKVQDALKKAWASAVEEDPEFAAAAKVVFGSRGIEDGWMRPAKLFPYDNILEMVDEGQVWVID